MAVADDAPLPRRRVWPAALLVALVAALGLKLVAELHGSGLPAVAVDASAAASAPKAAGVPEPQWGQPGEAAARVARAASAALATARGAAGLSPLPPAETLTELCGVGRLSLPVPEGSAASADARSTWDRLPQPLGEPAWRQAVARVLAALSAPRQPDRLRAAAQVLGAGSRADAAWPAVDLAATRRLARLARGSQDPVVLRWALAVCSREAQPSAECQRLSARDLVRLAPEDGLNWLALAQMPGLAPAARDRALQKAAQATQYGAPSAQLPLAVDAVWPEELPGYLRQKLLLTAQALDTALSRPGPERALDLCTAQSLSDSGRRGVCERLARQMLRHGRDLEIPGTVAVLGARLGWPDAEVEALRQEEAALSQAAASSVASDQPYACAVIDDTRQWLRSVAADGELQAVRRRLAMKATTPKPAASRP